VAGNEHRSRGRRRPTDTSWDQVAGWYDGWVGTRGLTVPNPAYLVSSSVPSFPAVSCCTQLRQVSCPLVSSCVLLVPRVRDISVTRRGSRILLQAHSTSSGLAGSLCHDVAAYSGGPGFATFGDGPGIVRLSSVKVYRMHELRCTTACGALPAAHQGRPPRRPERLVRLDLTALEVNRKRRRRQPRSQVAASRRRSKKISCRKPSRVSPAWLTMQPCPRS